MSIPPIGNTPPPRWQDNPPENTYQQQLDQIWQDYYFNNKTAAALSLLASLIHQVKNSGGDSATVSKALASLNQLQGMLSPSPNQPPTPAWEIGMVNNTCKSLVANL